jgi:hypothetical protein
MKLENAEIKNIEEKKAKNGKNYTLYTLSSKGKKVFASDWRVTKEESATLGGVVAVGDFADFVVEGEYNNVVSIAKSEKLNVQITSNDTTVSGQDLDALMAECIHSVAFALGVEPIDLLGSPGHVFRTVNTLFMAKTGKNGG